MNLIDTLPANDTLVVTVKDAQDAVIAARQRDLLKQEVVILKEDVRLYNLQIESMKKLDSANVEMIKLVIAQRDSKQQQIDNLGEIIKGKDNEIKKWRRKNRLTAIAGVATTIGAGWLGYKAGH